MSGRFISAAEFAGEEPTFTIRSIETVLLQEPDGRERERTAVFFREETRGWVLNMTNGICLEAMFGDDQRKWVGKRVTLTAALIEWGDGLRVGVRVKGSPYLSDYLDVFIQLPYRDAYFMRLVPTPIRWVKRAA